MHGTLSNSRRAAWRFIGSLVVGDGGHTGARSGEQRSAVFQSRCKPRPMPPLAEPRRSVAERCCAGGTAASRATGKLLLPGRPPPNCLTLCPFLNSIYPMAPHPPALSAGLDQWAPRKGGVQMMIIPAATATTTSSALSPDFYLLSLFGGRDGSWSAGNAMAACVFRVTAGFARCEAAFSPPAAADRAAQRRWRYFRDDAQVAPGLTF